MKIKSMLVALIGSVMITVGAMSAPVTQAVPVTPVQQSSSIDISMFTNHQALVGYCLDRVGGVSVNVSCDAGANRPSSRYYQYPSKVKTLEGIMGLVTNDWYNIPVVTTNSYIGIKVEFSADYDGSTIFVGYGGGLPTVNHYGQWVLADQDQSVEMRLASYVNIPIGTNLYISSARMVYGNDNVGYEANSVGVNGNVISFPSEQAGKGILVLEGYSMNEQGYYHWFRKALDLKKSGVEVPITDVLVQVIIRDSEDFRSSVDKSDLSLMVSSYVMNDSGYIYGKVPLLTPTYTRATIVRLQTSTWYYQKGVSGYNSIFVNAGSYEIKNLETGAITTVTAGANGYVDVTLQKGSYHIQSKGLEFLRSWWDMTPSIGKG